MAAHGAIKLALGDINLEQLEETKVYVRARVPEVETLLLELDVRSEESVQQAIEKIVTTYGRIDYAINNAGISGPFMPTENVPFSEWQRLLDVNLNGVWLCQRAEIQQMLKQDLQETR